MPKLNQTDKVTPMPTELKNLLLTGFNMAGTQKFPDAILSVEEEMTITQVDLSEKFLKWLEEHHLTVGHGTIDLRFHEFRKKLKPKTMDEAAAYAKSQERV
jgi:hypothetical protein